MWVREDAGLEELSGGDASLVSERTELGVGEHGEYSRLVRGQAVTNIKIDRLEDRVGDFFRLHANSVHIWRLQLCCDSRII